MGELDLRRQEYLIRASLASRRPFAGRAGHRAQTSGSGSVLANTTSDPAQILSLAIGLGDRLIADSSRAHGRMNWVGLQLLGEHTWSLGPAGAGLADGYGGIALFLAELGRLSGAGRFLEAAADAARPVPRLIDVLADHPEHAAAVGPGGYSGVGGVGYCASRLARLLDDEPLRASIPQALRALGHACGPAEREGTLDVADGLAGALLSARAISAQHPSPEADGLIARLTARLASASGPAGPGFVWGSDGIAFALGRTPAPAPAPAATTATAPEVSGSDSEDLGWCQGLAGTASAGAPEARRRYLDRLTRVAERSDRLGCLRDSSLCHGALGVLEPLASMSEAGDTRANALLHVARSALPGLLDDGSVRFGTPDGVPTPGLLSGLAGVGYGLLRLAFGSRVPSVLHMSPAS